ncbi:diguanylate cyclase [Candidatus Hydrogenedentota bacterium]
MKKNLSLYSQACDEFDNVSDESASPLLKFNSEQGFVVMMEAIWNAKPEDAPSPAVIIDCFSHERLQDMEHPLANEKDTVVFPYRALEAVEQGGVGEVKVFDRFIIVLSEHYSAALVGRDKPMGLSDEEPDFVGFWAFNVDVVSWVRDALLGRLTEKRRQKSADLLKSIVMLEDPQNQENFVVSVTRDFMNRMLDLSKSSSQEKDDLFTVLAILRALSSARGIGHILFTFVEKIAEVIQVARCSVVRVDKEGRTGHVVASHEDPDIRDIQIPLDKYPEVLRAIETKEPVVIQDIQQDPIMADVKRFLDNVEVSSVIVLPIIVNNDAVGSLLLRSARKQTGFTSREIRFCQIVASAAASAIEKAHLVESLKDANSSLETLATTDDLTGIYNHRYFRTRFEEEFERAKRYDLALSMTMLDIDFFKRVNDTFGHFQGDIVLKEVCVIVNGTIRQSDFFARYGGEEFVVVLPQTGREGASSEAERIRMAIEGHQFTGLPEDYELTVSMGVSCLESGSELTSEDLLKQADRSLYVSKESGRNKVTTYSSGLMIPED